MCVHFLLEVNLEMAKYFPTRASRAREEGSTMEWKTEGPPAVVRTVSKIGTRDVRVTVGPAHGDPKRMWQYIIVTCGQHSARSQDDCLKQWPREALRLARAALDEFERQLPPAALEGTETGSGRAGETKPFSWVMPSSLRRRQ